jgi:hypothetical protein
MKIMLLTYLMLRRCVSGDSMSLLPYVSLCVRGYVNDGTYVN